MGQGERRSVGVGGWYSPFRGVGRKGVVSVGAGWDIVGFVGGGMGRDVFVMMFLGAMGFYVVVVGFSRLGDLVGAVLQLHLTLERLCSWEQERCGGAGLLQ